ncbi:hypothetical protein LCGC14_3120130, partial [marine sediment metagenome]
MNSSKLAQHIKNLRATSRTTSRGQLRAVESLLFWGTAADKNYLPYLKGCVGSYTTHLALDTIKTITQVQMRCAKKGISRLVSTSIPLLKMLLDWDKRATPSLDNYAGSYFTIPALKKGGPDIEVVFIKPLAHLVTVPHGRFMATRLISKFTAVDRWYTPTE